MLYISIGAIFIVYIYMFKKQKDLMKYIPISHRGLINLYQVINSKKSKVSYYKLYFNVGLLFTLIITMTKSLNLNFLYSLSIILITVLLIPLVIIWQLNYYRQEYDFNNLVTYINQFILVFKSYPKVYPSLVEIENTISGDLNYLVNKSIEDIKLGNSSFEALSLISNQYPHFIVFNLHSLVYSIEQYGSLDYFEALDLVQDDLDDWIEDVNTFNYNKKRIVQKIKILILFAYIICLASLRMLFSIKVEVASAVYQTSMFLFCLLLILTYLIATSLLNAKWIERSESI